MACSHDTPTGPPTFWVPPCVLPAIPPDQVSPHPSGEGRGMCGWLAIVGSKMGVGWVVGDEGDGTVEPLITHTPSVDTLSYGL